MKTNINRTIKLSLLVALAAGFILSTKLGERTTHAYSSVPPSSYTGAPSFGASIPAEQTCASSGCHSGTNNLNDGQGTFKIVAPASYVPGQVYTITVSLKRGSTLPAAGFQLMAVDSSGAGEIEMVGKLDTEENSPFITIRQASIGASFRRYMIHITSAYPSTVAGSGQADWQVKWTAPAAGHGAIIFYASGVAADGSKGASGDFVYTTSATVLSSTPAAVVTQNSASGTTSDLTPNGIASGYGLDLASQTVLATDTDPTMTGIQLPTTLAGTTVSVKDSAGTARLAALFFVSPLQINYQIPGGTAAGTATITVTSSLGIQSIGTVNIASVAPGIFTVLQNGTGLAAAEVQRVSGQVQTFEPTAQYVNNAWSAIPVDWKNQTDNLYLVLYGTGVRNVTALNNVGIKIGTTTLPAVYAGSQNFFVGVDQINFLLPRALAGSGEVNAIITVDGKNSNTVKLNFK